MAVYSSPLQRPCLGGKVGLLQSKVDDQFCKRKLHESQIDGKATMSEGVDMKTSKALERMRFSRNMEAVFEGKVRE